MSRRERSVERRRPSDRYHEAGRRSRDSPSHTARDSVRHRARDSPRHRARPRVDKPYSSSSSSPSPPRKGFRFDSPPKEAARIVNLHGLEGAPLHGLRAMKAAETAQKSYLSEQTKLSKEIYVGNVPSTMPIGTLILRLNELLISIGATTLAGSPIVSGWLGGEGQFAFLEFRTAQEANNTLSLNGHLLEGCVLKVGRPRGAGAALADAPAPVGGIATVFALDDSVGLARQTPLEESVRIEQLVLVGAPPTATQAELEQIVAKFGPIQSPSLYRNCLLFKFEQLPDQRKCAYESFSSLGLSYDRDYLLALLRVDEAVAAGYINIIDEQISVGLGRPSTSAPTRILWMTNFPPDDIEEELRSECDKFGSLSSINFFRVPKDKITVDYGHTCPAESMELVAVVEFSTVREAVQCRKYLTGCSVFFLNESNFDQKLFDSFESNRQTVCNAPAVTDEKVLGHIRRGKYVSVESQIIAANKQRVKKIIAPEESEIID